MDSTYLNRQRQITATYDHLMEAVMFKHRNGGTRQEIRSYLTAEIRWFLDAGLPENAYDLYSYLKGEEVFFYQSGRKIPYVVRECVRCFMLDYDAQLAEDLKLRECILFFDFFLLIFLFCKYVFY